MRWFDLRIFKGHGTADIPKVTLDVLMKTLQEPQSDKHKQEDALSSRVVDARAVRQLGSTIPDPWQ